MVTKNLIRVVVRIRVWIRVWIRVGIRVGVRIKVRSAIRVKVGVRFRATFPTPTQVAILYLAQNFGTSFLGSSPSRGQWPASPRPTSLWPMENEETET